MKPLSELTVEDLDQELLALCQQYPDRRNPRNGTMCVYQSEEGERCLIGHWLIETRGESYNSVWDDGPGFTADNVLISLNAPEEVWDRARKWQEVADRSGRRWGDIPRGLLIRYGITL